MDIRGFFGGVKSGAKSEAKTPTKKKTVENSEGDTSSSKKIRLSLPLEPDLCDTPESTPSMEGKRNFSRLNKGVSSNPEQSSTLSSKSPSPSRVNKKAKTPPSVPDTPSKDKPQISPVKSPKHSRNLDEIETDISGTELKDEPKYLSSATASSAKRASLSSSSSSSSSLASSLPTHALPLDGKKFVITGTFDGMDRGAVEDLVLRYGGKVNSCVLLVYIKFYFAPPLPLPQYICNSSRITCL